MKAKEIYEGRNHPCIVVDVQPEYSGINDGDENPVFPEIISFVNAQTGPILMLVNAEDQGLSGDTINDIKMYWNESGFNEENWYRVKIINKGYGYLRSWMDQDVPYSTIIKTIRLMYQQKVTDSRQLEFPAFNERTPEITDIMNTVQAMDGDGISVEWLAVSLLKKFNNAYIMGGGRNECLREVELLMNAFNIHYKRIDSLVYG